MRALLATGPWFGLLAVFAVSAVAAGQVVTVTAKDLIASGHRVEVTVGTRIVWADPHFERVWFGTRSGAPRLRRDGGTFAATFEKPGEYRGAFTLVGSHGRQDVEPMTVVVRSQQ